MKHTQTHTHTQTKAGASAVLPEQKSTLRMRNVVGAEMTTEVWNQSDADRGQFEE